MPKLLLQYAAIKIKNMDVLNTCNICVTECYVYREQPFSSGKKSSCSHNIFRNFRNSCAIIFILSHLFVIVVFFGETAGAESEFSLSRANPLDGRFVYVTV